MNRLLNRVLCLLLVFLASSVNGEVTATEAPLDQAILSVEKKWDQGTSCVFSLLLRNTSSFHISSVVPEITAIIRDNVVYGTVSGEFFELRPSNEQSRKFQYLEISCEKIIGLKVTVAGHCKMGSLHDMSSTSEECGKLIRVDKSMVVNISNGK